MHSVINNISVSLVTLLRKYTIIIQFHPVDYPHYTFIDKMLEPVRFKIDFLSDCKLTKHLLSYLLKLMVTE